MFGERSPVCNRRVSRLLPPIEARSKHRQFDLFLFQKKRACFLKDEEGSEEISKNSLFVAGFFEELVRPVLGSRWRIRAFETG